MKSNYAIRKRQYDDNVHDIRDRIDRETRRIQSLDAEGRMREAQYIQDWNNTVREIEEYIRTNVPKFLKEGESVSSYQAPRTNSRSPISPITNPVPKQNDYGSVANSVNNSSTSKNRNAQLESFFEGAPWLAILFTCVIAIVFGSVIVAGYVVL